MDVRAFLKEPDVIREMEQIRKRIWQSHPEVKMSCARRC